MAEENIKKQDFKKDSIVEKPSTSKPKPKRALKKTRQPYRLVINPNQTQQKALYENSKGFKVLFDKNDGCYFSFDKSNDSEIEFFEKKGFLVYEQKETNKEE